jgi:hypothetical protein
VQRCGQSLVLGLRPFDGGQEFAEPLCPLVGAARELEAVVADVHELRNADDPARVFRRSAADARDERIAGREAPQLSLRLGRNGRVVGSWDDRR